MRCGAILTDLYRGCMRGRTMYVVPFCMGPLAEDPKLGVGDHRLRIRRRLDANHDPDGRPAASRRSATTVSSSRRCIPWRPARARPADVPWPCSDTKYITHFPETREIWSYGSGYGGNALLGKKCYSLRIASVMARDEGWLAEHMLILKLISPENKAYYVAAAVPVGLRQDQPRDDPAHHPGLAGRDARATTSPGCGSARTAGCMRSIRSSASSGCPGTNWAVNPNAMKTIAAGNTVFTNVALTDEGGVWWEGLEGDPQHLIDWKGEDWTPDSKEPAAHPNSRYCTPMSQCPTLAPEWDDPQGVPISAILFGGRRKTTVPLVTQARDWQHGVFIGATLGSEKTAAAEGQVGTIRRDPMAMLPFMGYNAGDYCQHWLDLGKNADESKLPKIFFVNWFRRGGDGRFLWPGFGENSRVLKWIIERVEARPTGVSTPSASCPQPVTSMSAGLDVAEADVAEALAVDPEEWRAELPQIEVVRLPRREAADRREGRVRSAQAASRRRRLTPLRDDDEETGGVRLRGCCSPRLPGIGHRVFLARQFGGGDRSRQSGHRGRDGGAGRTDHHPAGR